MQGANAGSWNAKQPRNGLRPRDSNLSVVSQAADGAAPAAEKKPASRSMSELLAARSEAAVSGSKAKKQCVPALPDIDSVDAADPLAATDFVTDIFSYYKRVEPQLRIAPDYMSRQVRAGWGQWGGWRRVQAEGAHLTCTPPCPRLLPPLQTDINDKMRAILIDWLVDVHLKFKVGTCVCVGGGGGEGGGDPTGMQWSVEGGSCLLVSHLERCLAAPRPPPPNLTPCAATCRAAPPAHPPAPRFPIPLPSQLMPETLYLTVNLIDRFLEQKQVTRKHLQLVGVTAMLIASKYEEIWAPEVGRQAGWGQGRPGVRAGARLPPVQPAQN